MARIAEVLSISRNRVTMGLFTVVAIASPLLEVRAGIAQENFRITSLGSLQGDSLPIEDRPYRLNDNGQVTGYIGSGSAAQGAIWQNGVITSLGTFAGGTVSKGHAINAEGQVVGLINDHFGDTFGGLYTNGGWSSLLWPSSGGIQYTTAAAINSSQQIVGWGSTTPFDSPVQEALLFYPGQNTYPTRLANYGSDLYSAAFDINDSGYAVGYSSQSTSSTGYHAVLWNVNTNTVYDISGLTQSVALSISNTDEVVGYIYNSAGTTFAAIFTGGQPTAISPLQNETSSVANAVNDSGYFVGNATLSSGGASVQHAFIGLNSITVDLNSIQNSSWTLNTATDINDQGQIVGTGTLNGATLPYIATPELHRQTVSSQAWEAAGGWSYGLTPDSIHPVYVDNATVLGPVANVTVAELNIGTVTAANLILNTNTLTVSNQNAVWADGYTTIGKYGTLSGTGTLKSNVTVLGTVSPGDAPGMLTIVGDVTFELGSVTELQILGNGANQFDVLNIEGNAQLAGELLLDFSDLSGPLDQSLTVFEASDLSGQFSSVEYEGANASQYKATQIGNEIVITPVSVPEPSAALLLLFAAGAACPIAIIRRRRSQKEISSSKALAFPASA